jgi:H+/Cl- antiporter ClcA
MCTDNKYKLAIGLIFIIIGIFLSFCFYYLSKLRDEVRTNIYKYGLIFIAISIKILILMKRSTNELKTQLSEDEQTEENNSENGFIIDGKMMFNDNKRN